MDLSHEELKQSILSLLKLQEIDGGLFLLNEEFEKPSKEIVDLEKNVSEAQKQLRLVERSYRQIERERRSYELRLITLQEDLKKSETKRKEVRNTKEEFSASKETENFQKKLQDLKKLMDEKTAVLDEKKAQVDEKTKTFEGLQAELNELTAAREARMGELAGQKEGLLKRRETHIGLVADQLFSMYERIQKLRRGSGVAVVKDGICTGCFVSLPPQLNQQLQKLESLITCSSCSRILFPESLLEATTSEATPADGDASLKTSNG